ncbi:sensor domain-containing diguanylate cyclase [Marinilactibacillus sp. Marseille-P9653]|uniref:sensor domain-containing diguanylate cyclase n=1 Tax=Marinilactibacillus sp. Marseille-P9653 TaxID=2866583 RepID=UPI001CE446A2|nr:sensor domain-containing diguanylate cyclase [Marinilactibacillus sp. Marseille-P9653]
MTIKRKNQIWLLVIIGWFSFYFGWLLFWSDNMNVQTTGGNLISLIGSFVPVLWITDSFRYNQLHRNKRYWQLLLFASASYLLAEFCWIFTDTILTGEPSFPGIYDVFYVLSGFGYFLAFAWRIARYAKKSFILKFLFDILVILSVALTFSWYYILGPIISETSGSMFASVSVALFYLVGDIVLVLCVSIFYFGGEYFYQKKAMYYIILAIFIQIISISLYFLESTQAAYLSGSWFDPLFVLPVLLIGYTSLLEGECDIQEITELPDTEDIATSIPRLILPYTLVVVLFTFMINHSSGLDVISIGSGISIILVILRQFIVIFENRTLVKQYYDKAEELEISEERYRSLFEYHPDSVFSLDLKGTIESMNPVGATLLGRDQSSVIGTPITEYIDAQQLKQARENIMKINEGWINSHEFPFQNNHGKNLWIHMTHIPILVKSKLVGSFGVGRDITEHKLDQEKIHFYAYHDHLTGLANRRSFENNLQETIDSSKVNKTQFAILFLDLDKFKEINDYYGHAVGDEILVSISKRIKEFIEEDDIAARLGGDEFTILIKNVSAYLVPAKIQSLQELLSEPHIINGHSLNCTASIGFSYYPVDGLTATELLSKADNAMYRVKRSEQHFK